MTQQRGAESVIPSFLKHYRKEKHHWKISAEAVGSICKEALKDRSVPCIVKSRAKDYESLKKKLNDRNQDSSRESVPYQTFEDIWEDIKDFGGARIALYFPKQASTVDAMIYETFEVKGKPKVHSGKPDSEEEHSDKPDSKEDNLPTDEYQSRFPRYRATHYLVQLKKDTLQKYELDAQSTIELQVTSVLGHAWSEVEHDTVYKELRHPASMDEKRIIDGLGGAIHMGECFLDQLYDSQSSAKASAEKEFQSIYDIGFFVSNWIFEAARKRDKSSESILPIKDFVKQKDQKLGPISALNKLLTILEMNTQKDLKLTLKGLYFSKKSNGLYLETKLRYKGFEVTPLIYIMDQILASKHSSITDRERMMQPRDHLRVLASTMIWLDELFGPFSTWSEKLLGHMGPKQDEEYLLWLGSTEVVTILIEEGDLDDEDRMRVQVLWEWFNTHPEGIVQFALRISKLGLLRNFKKEIHLLVEIYVLMGQLIPTDTSD